MYTITRNIKILSFSLMTLGILGIAYGFYVAPKTIEESKEIIAASHDDSHSSDSHSCHRFINNFFHSNGHCSGFFETSDRSSANPSRRERHGFHESHAFSTSGEFTAV